MEDMTPPDTEIETVEVLLHRSGIMECLLEETLDKPALVDALDVSRSTVDRGVRELETNGLITYAEGRYTATTLGEFATEQFFDLVETVRIGTRLEPFLRWVPADSFDLDLQYLSDADLFVPRPNDPYAMINRHVKVVENAREHRVVLPLVGLHGMEAVHEAVVENEGESEAIVAPGVAETFQSNPNYTPLFEALVASGRFDVFEYDGDIPYFVGILDETVQIGVDEEGEPRALVETTADEVYEWAEEQVERYKQQSKRLT